MRCEAAILVTAQLIFMICLCLKIWNTTKAKLMTWISFYKIMISTPFTAFPISVVAFRQCCEWGTSLSVEAKRIGWMYFFLSTWTIWKAVGACSSANTYHKLDSEGLATQSIISRNRIAFETYHRDPPKVLQDQVNLAAGHRFITKLGSAPLCSHPMNRKIGLEVCSPVEQAVKESVLHDLNLKMLELDAIQSRSGVSNYTGTTSYPRAQLKH